MSTATIDHIWKRISESGPFVELTNMVRSAGRGDEIFIRGAAGSLQAMAAASLVEKQERQILFIASDEDRAEKLSDDCALLLGEPSVKHFGARPLHEGQALDLTAVIAQVETLRALVSSSRVLVVASAQSAAERVPAPDMFRKRMITINAGTEFQFEQLIGSLEELGFNRKNFVETYGDIAVRGGILDVFPFIGEHPIRIEFWGNSVESIREFDILSQRSVRELQSASIIPSFAEDQSGGASVASLSSTLFDYLAGDALIMLDAPETLAKEIDNLRNDGAVDLLPSDELLSRVEQRTRVIMSPFGGEMTGAGIDLQSVPQPSFGGRIKEAVKYVEQLVREGTKVIFTCDTEDEVRRLKDLMSDQAGREPTDPGTLDSGSGSQQEVLAETLHSGFIFKPTGIALFTEHELFGRLKRRGTAKRRRFRGFTQKELRQLHDGDYVVHVDHGIGTFAGLRKITVGGIEQEVMQLLFAEEDVLYVNLNFMNRVQKYSSQEGHVPRLSRLGGGEWDKIKARAKKRIKDIARDIIALYARRKTEEGHAFSHDTAWQQELEASFMYEDTVDQAAATIDVKADMEKSAPMDRLICGDVGFGKTEVAVRAAFKAVMDGKQVAVLVPTTILAIQHYNTFHDRLSRYTTRIEHITRFKSAKEQKRVVESLRNGSVDIVIGTHRLLSKDIGFRDLGLLIIDEEHRFGVSAKEKLRQLRSTVDTLTLTATPIPRTLHFSLIGARDLSLITTPPRNRIPILTEIIPADTRGRNTQWQIIREAVMRELHRGGQVYIVHDRVSTIEAIAEQVKRHIPEARVHTAHGQMSGHQLEEAMLAFLERKYDVLVCTKIIESGVDIPNVNTMIINRADMFGLAELYQLRGRVGRSNVQAYAYLLTAPLGSMPKPTLQRLQAIEEFTELGSGFNLAMRDLEIRGAGNLLGGEQSGFIMEMGYELYEKTLHEAVDELKAEEFKGLIQEQPEGSRRELVAGVQTVVETDIEALIPDVYVESSTERLDVYRRLTRMHRPAEVLELRAELRDRFGELPKETDQLLEIVLFRIEGERAGLQKVVLRGDSLTATLPPETDVLFYGDANDPDDKRLSAPFQRMLRMVTGGKDKRVRLLQNGKDLAIQFRMEEESDASARLIAARARIEELRKWMTD